VWKSEGDDTTFTEMGSHDCKRTDTCQAIREEENKFLNSSGPETNNILNLHEADEAVENDCYKLERDDLLAWDLLDDMVSKHLTVFNFGGCLSASELEFSIDGESWHSSALASREASYQAILELKKICGDTSWILHSGDLVFWREDQVASHVMRIGYGPYDREVRIAYVHENANVRGAGRWVCSADCYKLELGDTIVATASMTDASEDRNKIDAGTICRFRGFDEDGDLLIAIDNMRTKPQHVMMFRDELQNFLLQ
jgi:hypothetical protein